MTPKHLHIPQNRKSQKILGSQRNPENPRKYPENHRKSQKIPTKPLVFKKAFVFKAKLLSLLFVFTIFHITHNAFVSSIFCVFCIFAQGISRFSSSELEQIKGLSNEEILRIFPGKNRSEVVHRDHLAPTLARSN